jgi:hypothetical protein
MLLQCHFTLILPGPPVGGGHPASQELKYGFQAKATLNRSWGPAVMSPLMQAGQDPSNKGRKYLPRS